ncbi:hypothetical protein J056_001820 [Wallemia ichthyophaga EXF-994]|uniref:Uncharacterized protein n=1 Tax=Wallemia ichthyophaga (strain EXF-994 / CBS 113033) TaxID=1299270 RepID=R9ABJ3_WALI9|nr:uncharacterized protein J056_001820 [Wallemia ichthyophaga EXF-994]EOQ99497.1 hypothetical protein J056_001820 [Wallemia ichthyophaga EXF-994]
MRFTSATVAAVSALMVSSAAMPGAHEQGHGQQMGQHHHFGHDEHGPHGLEGDFDIGHGHGHGHEHEHDHHKRKTGKFANMLGIPAQDGIGANRGGRNGGGHRSGGRNNYNYDKRHLHEEDHDQFHGHEHGHKRGGKGEHGEHGEHDHHDHHEHHEHGPRNIGKGLGEHDHDHHDHHDKHHGEPHHQKRGEHGKHHEHHDMHHGKPHHKRGEEHNEHHHDKEGKKEGKKGKMTQHEFDRRAGRDHHDHHSGAMSMLTSPFVLVGSAVIALFNFN